MAFIPVVNVARSALQWDFAGQQVVNVFHVKFTAQPSSSDLDTLNNDLIGWWNTALKAYITPSLVLKQCQSTDQTSASGITRINVLGTPSPGTFSDSPLPNNVAVVISHRTAARGRSYRGRTYLAGMGLTQRTDSLSMGLASIVNLLTAFGSLLSIINSASRALSVVSRFSNKIPRITGVATPITAFTADQAFDSQRRRLLGRGA